MRPCVSEPNRWINRGWWAGHRSCVPVRCDRYVSHGPGRTACIKKRRHHHQPETVYCVGSSALPLYPCRPDRQARTPIATADMYCRMLRCGATQQREDRAGVLTRAVGGEGQGGVWQGGDGHDGDVSVTEHARGCRRRQARQALLPQQLYRPRAAARAHAPQCRRQRPAMPRTEDCLASWSASGRPRRADSGTLI